MAYVNGNTAFINDNEIQLDNEEILQIKKKSIRTENWIHVSAKQKFACDPFVLDYVVIDEFEPTGVALIYEDCVKHEGKVIFDRFVNKIFLRDGYMFIQIESTVMLYKDSELLISVTDDCISAIGLGCGFAMYDLVYEDHIDQYSINFSNLEIIQYEPDIKYVINEHLYYTVNYSERICFITTVIGDHVIYHEDFIGGVPEVNADRYIIEHLRGSTYKCTIVSQFKASRNHHILFDDNNLLRILPNLIPYIDNISLSIVTDYGKR